jgi:hypothetical protein
MSKILLQNLSTYSDIYDLGITQTEVGLIENLWDTYNGANLLYVYGPGPKDQEFVLKFNNYDRSILLQKTDPAAKKFGYKLFRLYNGRYYIKFAPTAVDLKYLHELGDITSRDQQVFLFSSLEELRDHVFSTDINLFLNNQVLSISKIETIYWLCNELSRYKPSQFSDSKFYKSMPNYVYHIIDVLQLPNDIRIALYAYHTDSYRATIGNNIAVKTYIVTPDNPAYNWTDPDRYFSHINNKTGHGKVYYVGPNPLFPSEAALSRYVRGHSQVVLENQTLETIEKRDARKQIEDAAIQKAQTVIQKKLTNKTAELESGEEFSFNDVTFRAHEIEYESQIITSKAVKVSNIIKNFLTNLQDEAFNFELIFGQFCRELIRAAEAAGEAKAQIGAVKIDIEIKKKKNTVNVDMITNYINGYRINKIELHDVLLRALCYNKTEDYENYLESVSKCSLRYHRYIASGIALKVRDDITGEDAVEFKIGLDRDKNRNYISFGDKIRYPVKDTNKLLNLVGQIEMSRVINVLLNPDIVGVTGADVRHIIETGRKALIEERNKETQLLSQAIQLFKCEKIEDALLDNGRVISGYTVNGKLRNYIIETSSIRVFEYPSGKYLCMVDKGQNEHANTARLVSRMFALANDSKLTNEITTLQKND